MKWIIIISIVAILIFVLPKMAKGKSMIYGANSPLNPFYTMSWYNLPLIDKVPGNKEAFGKRVLEIAAELSVTPDSLMAIMDFESAGTFEANKWGGWNGAYVGLIQFGGAAAQDLGTTQSKLSNLTNVEQLDWVEKYFKMWRNRLGINKIDGIADLYLMVLYPGAIRYRDRSAALPIPGQQAHMLYDENNNITKNSITAMFKSRYPNTYLS